MKVKFASLTCLIGILSMASFTFGGVRPAYSTTLPDPTHDIPLVSSDNGKATSATLVVSGGCFWGVESVFEHVKGVEKAEAGYAGGQADTAHYDMVSTGTTGHAESVRITYDPSQISMGQLLKVFFSAAHDPTELNYQGPDHGTQYRSEIFTNSPEQQEIANDYITQLQAAKTFKASIVTKVEPLLAFYPAEDYHQNYARLHPYNPYILINDAPKVDRLQKDLPNLYVASKETSTP